MTHVLPDRPGWHLQRLLKASLADSLPVTIFLVFLKNPILVGFQCCFWRREEACSVWLAPDKMARARGGGVGVCCKDVAHTEMRVAPPRAPCGYESSCVRVCVQTCNVRRWNNTDGPKPDCAQIRRGGPVQAPRSSGAVGLLRRVAARSCSTCGHAQVRKRSDHEVMHAAWAGTQALPPSPSTAQWRHR